MLVTIHIFKHHLPIFFGVLSSTLLNDSDTPFEGIIQGNNIGPTIWVAVGTPLIEMMCSAGHGLKLEASLPIITDKFVDFSFVDNTGILSSD